MTVEMTVGGLLKKLDYVSKEHEVCVNKNVELQERVEFMDEQNNELREENAKLRELVSPSNYSETKVENTTPNELPYLETIVTTTERKYNENFGDDRVCVCGHTYDRHFDSYEQMEAVGCKYCDCFTFIEAPKEK